MTTATHTYNIANLDAEDRIAIDFICKQENDRITSENASRANQNPPLAPLPLIGDTNAERKTAYEAYMRDKCGRMHLQWIQHAKDKRSEEQSIKDIRRKLPTATDQQLTQIAGILGARNGD